MSAVITKTHILDEIQRTAAENGGKPLGQNRFRTETGIKEYDWKAHWARWGDALVEAGFARNKLQSPTSKEELAKRYADLAVELGHLPVHAEIRLKRRRHVDFPSCNTFHDRFGNKRALIRAVAGYCKGNADYQDVLGWCEEYLGRDENVKEAGVSWTGSNREVSLGSVYLAKSGRYYKIGRSNAASRREYEIGLQLPEKLEMVHVIPTDDPSGIEAYWHKRFDAKRKNGEWFDLDRADVSAFKRWKFM
jgi:hypothetical protein